MEKKQKYESFVKTWNVLLPFLLYYLTYSITDIVLEFLLNVSMEHLGNGYSTYIMNHAVTVTGLERGLCMLIGIVPLKRMLEQELTQRNLEEHMHKRRAMSTLLVLVLAMSSAMGLNILLKIAGIANESAAYQSVEENQYGVAFGVGLILYGIISPLAEEVVFRGIIYNRMRRQYPMYLAIIVSGILFGAYHGNVVQGIYGACMGILMAYVYERMGSFLIPYLFHAAANLLVFTVAHIGQIQSFVFRIEMGILLLCITAVCIVMIEKRFRVSERVSSKKTDTDGMGL